MKAIRSNRAIALALSLCSLAIVATTRDSAVAESPTIDAPQSWPSATDIYPDLGWQSRTVIPAPRSADAMAAFSFGSYPANGVYVYVISGWDGSFTITTSLFRYDVAQDQWTTLAPIPDGRNQVSAVVIDGKIYVPGGYLGDVFNRNPTDTLSIYDIGLNQWQSGAVLPQKAGDYAIGAYASRYVYVIGGLSSDWVELNNVQVYDTLANTWTAATPKPGTAVQGLRGGIVGNHIVVAGGYSGALNKTVADAYVGVIDSGDPTVIAWAPIASYPGGPVVRHGAGVPVATGPAQDTGGMNIVVFTGGDPDGAGISAKSDTWIYDLNSNTWRSGPDKPTGVNNIGNLAAFSSSGALYIASVGGVSNFNGGTVHNVNEWLTLGGEACPDLALSIDGGGSPVDPGSRLVYVLRYSIGTPGTAKNVTITDTVPLHTTFNSGASTPGWLCLPDDSPGNTCTLSVGDLSAGSSGSALFVVDVPSPGVDQFTNDAAIACGGATPFAPEQNLANNAAHVDTANSTRIFANGLEIVDRN